MSRRKRFRDRKHAPGVPEIQKQGGEGWKRRHSRRLHFNLNRQPVMEEWCERAGVTITVTNEGHHWQFVRGEVIVEWWPSSAKCVINKNWRQGIHTHDVGQLQLILQEAFDPAGVHSQQGQ